MPVKPVARARAARLVVSQALNTIVLESAFANGSGDAVAAVITSADPGSRPEHVRQRRELRRGAGQES